MKYTPFQFDEDSTLSPGAEETWLTFATGQAAWGLGLFLHLRVEGTRVPRDTHSVGLYLANRRNC